MGWDMERLLPDGLQVQTIAIKTERVTITVRPRGPQAPCPARGQLSAHVHRYSQRTLADLPRLGRRVQLCVRARHFYCLNPACPQKVFSERLNGTARVYARRTDRLSAALVALVYEAGGAAGARTAQRLGMPVSPDTLLRLLQRASVQAQPSPTVLGVDDWSWKRGQRFGTILVDLERHCPVDLLPERSAASFAAWLAAHAGVRVIARDRGETYIQGATLGAPAACQVADRFHLLHNLNAAVEEILRRQHGALQATTAALRRAALTAQTSPGDALLGPLPSLDAPVGELQLSKEAARKGCAPKKVLCGAGQEQRALSGRGFGRQRGAWNLGGTGPPRGAVSAESSAGAAAGPQAP